MDNLQEKIYSKMPFEARVLYNILNNKGFKTFVVGGALRDLFIGDIHSESVKISDWDFATFATAEEIKDLFNKPLKVKNDMGRIVNLSGSTDLLIPSLGTTSVKIGRRRFEVTPIKDNDIIQDLMRRDFTINSLAFSGDGLISSYELCGRNVDIIEDLSDRKLCFNINPFTYTEDNPISIVRALRFANKYNLSIDEDTLDVFRYNGKLIRNINKGKLYMNFEKLMMLNNFYKPEYIVDSNLFSSVCPSWNEEYSKNLLVLMEESISRSSDIKGRLKFIYNEILNKDELIELYKSFGVKKEFIESLILRTSFESIECEDDR